MRSQQFCFHLLWLTLRTVDSVAQTFISGLLPSHAIWAPEEAAGERRSLKTVYRQYLPWFATGVTVVAFPASPPRNRTTIISPFLARGNLQWLRQSVVQQLQETAKLSTLKFTFSLKTGLLSTIAVSYMSQGIPSEIPILFFRAFMKMELQLLNH